MDNSRKIRVAIAGGTGYTGGELFRILLNHPDVEIVAATTTSSEGTPVASVHRDLIGETDLCFGKELNDPDVIFLCLGHGISRQFVDTHDIKPECRIIDLGNDFRLDGNYAGREFVYGLCESAREDIRKAHDVANPGCFATAIQLATLPLAAAGLINDEIHVTAITGSTGAGKKPGETTHFSYRSDNISIYKLFTHQHLAEIKQNLAAVRLSSATTKTPAFASLRHPLAGGGMSSPSSGHSDVEQTVQPIQIPEPITLYEDEAMIVVEKPSGMPSVPGLDGRVSLLEWLSSTHSTEPLSVIPSQDSSLISSEQCLSVISSEQCLSVMSGERGESRHPHVVHRLDMDTSGVMVFAKTHEAAVNLRRQFEEHSVQKI